MVSAKDSVRTALAAGALAASLGGAGLAQDAAGDAIEGCRSLPTEAERFACMEGLVRGMSAARPAEPPAPVSEAVAAPETETPAAADEDQGRRFLRLPFTGRREEPTPVSTTSAAASPESFGAERLQSRDEERAEREVMTASVVGFEEAHYRRLRVELDNGQVWEQTDGVPPWRVEQYGAPDKVEIFPSRFGGYRMRLVGKNLTLNVDRVR